MGEVADALEDPIPREPEVLDLAGPRAVGRGLLVDAEVAPDILDAGVFGRISWPLDADEVEAPLCVPLISAMSKSGSSSKNCTNHVRTQQHGVPVLCLRARFCFVQEGDCRAGRVVRVRNGERWKVAALPAPVDVLDGLLHVLGDLGRAVVDGVTVVRCLLQLLVYAYEGPDILGAHVLLCLVRK